MIRSTLEFASFQQTARCPVVKQPFLAALTPESWAGNTIMLNRIYKLKNESVMSEQNNNQIPKLSDLRLNASRNMKKLSRQCKANNLPKIKRICAP